MVEWVETTVYPIWLESMLQTAVILAVALLVAGTLARASAAARHGLLAAALVLTVVAGAGRPFLPKVPVGTTLVAEVEPATPLASDRPEPAVAAERDGEVAPSIAAPAELPGTAPIAAVNSEPLLDGHEVGARTTDAGMGWRTAAVAGWALGAAWLLFAQLVGAVRVALLRRRGGRPGAVIEERVARLARRAGLARAPATLLVDRLATPATAGILRPVVLIPRRLPGELEGDRLDAVLLHELTHVGRRDVAFHELARFVRALAWPVPFIWMASRRMGVDREIATDAAVVALCESRLPYAEGLLHVLGSRARRALPAPTAALGLGADGRASMVRRVELITGGGGRGWGRVGRWRAAAMVLVLLVSASAASSVTAFPQVVRQEGSPVVETVDLLLVVDLPDPAKRPGEFVVEGEAIRRDGLNAFLQRHGVGEERFRDPEDPRASTTKLHLRAHRRRAMADVIDVLSAAARPGVGIRKTSVAVLGKPEESIHVRWAGRAVSSLGALRVHLDGTRMTIRRRPSDREITTDFSDGVRAGDVIQAVVEHHPDVVSAATEVVLTTASPVRSAGVAEDPKRPEPVLPPAGEIRAALAAARAWTVAQQAEDGSWPGGQRDEMVVGRTGLALLALLDAGGHSGGGPFSREIARGLRWLAERQREDGAIVMPGPSHSGHYGHAVATEALCVDLRRSGVEVEAGAARKAVNYILAAQNPYKAWRYGARTGDNDTCVTSWMVAALGAADAAGLEIPERSLEWAVNWLEEMTDQETGRIGYLKRGEPPVREIGQRDSFPASRSESLTAAGLVALRILTGDLDAPVCKLGLGLVHRLPPTWDVERGTVDHHYWFWGARLLSGATAPGAVRWRHALAQTLVERQNGSGLNAGAWEPVGPWGGRAGRIYSTATMALALNAVVN